MRTEIESPQGDIAPRLVPEWPGDSQLDPISIYADSHRRRLDYSARNGAWRHCVALTTGCSSILSALALD